jgi:hypothetical protein
MKSRANPRGMLNRGTPQRTLSGVYQGDALLTLALWAVFVIVLLGARWLVRR